MAIAGSSCLGSRMKKRKGKEDNAVEDKTLGSSSL